MKTKQTATLLLAAGKGERYGGEKQFEKIHKKEVLFWTIDSILSFKVSRVIVVIVPSGKISFIKKRYKNIPQVVIIAGGASRYESTKLGVEFVAKNLPEIKYIFVHDGVRPCAPRKLFTELYQAILKEKVDGIVPCLPVSDSIISFKGSMNNNQYLDRKILVTIQTPHLYNFSSLSSSLLQKGVKAMENAQLMEFSGKKISYIPGTRENIKLTHKHDLLLLKKLLQP